MAGKKSQPGDTEEPDPQERSSPAGDGRWNASSDLPGEKVMVTAPVRTHRLSPISELDSGEHREDSGPAGSSYSSSSSDKYSTGSPSTGSLSDSQQTEDACAGIVLDCLFCRFYDLCVALPGACARAASRSCPSYSHLSAPAEPVQTGDWICHCDFDCGLFDACHETGECLELAMEISEICYR